jgi:ferredoxin
MVLEISESVDVPVIGIGGISTAEDAIEYFMAGASAVELATASTVMGYEIYEDIYNGIAAFMKRKGYNSIEDFKGLTHRRIRERAEKKKQIIHEILLPKRSNNKCTVCGKCVAACAYGAIEMGESFPVIIPEKCQGCGLCSSVCAQKAIAQDYFAE